MSTDPSVPLFNRVGLVNSLEPRFRWITIPGFVRALAIIHLFVFALLVLRPPLAGLLAFDWGAIREGEVWRIISFYALPPVMPGPGFYPYLWLGLAIYVAFLVGDQLEEAWGSFRTTVFCLGTIACQVLSLVLICALFRPISAAWGSALLYQVVFFAFATIFPRYQFRLFFAVGVPAWVLAVAAGAFGLIAVLGQPFYLLYALGSLFPFTFWAGPILLGHLTNRATTQVRRAKFKSKVAKPGATAFHTCAACGATDQSHPNREFRVTPEGSELCSECLKGE